MPVLEGDPLADNMHFSTGQHGVHKPAQPRKRNLGAAILLAAIKDYRSMHDEIHESAEQFLYPQTPEWQDHYDWAVGLAEGLNPAWLRDALDRFRDKWDAKRSARTRFIKPPRQARKRRGTVYDTQKCS